MPNSSPALTCFVVTTHRLGRPSSPSTLPSIIRQLEISPPSTGLESSIRLGSLMYLVTSDLASSHAHASRDTARGETLRDRPQRQARSLGRLARAIARHVDATRRPRLSARARRHAFIRHRATRPRARAPRARSVVTNAFDRVVDVSRAGRARWGGRARTMGAIATARGDARRRRGGAQATRWRRRSSARG